MTKPAAFLATLVVTLLPAVASATCFGDRHEEASMSCADGTVWDADSRSCVPTTG